MIRVCVRTSSTFLHHREFRYFPTLDDVLKWAAQVKEGGHSINLAHDQDGLCALIFDGLPKDIRRMVR